MKSSTFEPGLRRETLGTRLNFFQHVVDQNSVIIVPATELFRKKGQVVRRNYRIAATCPRFIVSSSFSTDRKVLSKYLVCPFGHDDDLISFAEIHMHRVTETQLSVRC